ncbi:LysR family transcriptional regulator [Bradyrhizobium sp. Arg816]|uniref:LysR family transcriptional regulator n=1 Tax=Bradyrhizobium sp. Arg816 TaxID=2998491 RepID=UPI0034D6BFE6
MSEPGNRNDQPRATRLVDLRHLRYAMAASDCGSFRQAAEVLSLRHSVLSRSMGEFEHLIGTTLFERSARGVRPTVAGRAVLRIARLVLDQVEALVEKDQTAAAMLVVFRWASVRPSLPGIYGPL